MDGWMDRYGSARGAMGRMERDDLEKKYPVIGLKLGG